MIRLLPLRYNFRNLGRRRLRTALTALGIGMVVFVCVLLQAFAEGLRGSLVNSASELNAILLNANADTDLTRSRVDKGAADTVTASIEGVREEYGRRMISPEVHLGTNVKLVKDSKQENLGVVRGVRDIAFRVHPQVRLLEGDICGPGRKVMVGRLAAAKLGLPPEALYPGRTIYFEDDPWEIVGTFAAPGTVFESEIWCDVDDIIVSTKREEYSAITVVLKDAESFEDVEYFCKSRLSLELQAWKEKDFYGQAARTLQPIRVMVDIMILLVLLGGVVAGMNTMYTAVLGRFREFGALQTIGFSRLSIVLGLAIESVTLAVLGGVAGGAAARLADGFALKVPMGAFAFDIGPELMLYGVGLAAVMGLLGAILPGIKSARMKLVDSLRAL